MAHRFVWLLLGLVVGAIATVVVLKIDDTQDMGIARTSSSDDLDDDLSDSSSISKVGQASQFEDRVSVDRAVVSKPPSRASEQAQPPGFHEVALSESEKANLLQAPSVFLNRTPSDVLTRAMELGRVELVRADRDFDENEYVTQGWIYYEPIDGQVPVVLCLSQTKTIIDWMYCQEETRPQSP